MNCEFNNISALYSDANYTKKHFGQKWLTIRRVFLIGMFFAAAMVVLSLWFNNSWYDSHMFIMVVCGIIYSLSEAMLIKKQHIAEKFIMLYDVVKNHILGFVYIDSEYGCLYKITFDKIDNVILTAEYIVISGIVNQKRIVGGVEQKYGEVFDRITVPRCFGIQSESILYKKVNYETGIIQQ